MKVLVVAAHPDDEILGIGGTVLKHSSKGDRVYVVILGEGKTSRKPKRNIDENELNELKKEAANANKILGVKEVFFADFPDNRFDSVDLLDIVKKVEEYVKNISPDLIYTHHANDLNVDHRLTFQAVMTAARPIAGSMVKKIVTYETLSSSEWVEQEKVFIPNIYSNIQKEIEQKVQAMACYKSELRQYPHPRSLEGIKILAKKRGLEAGLEYAEGLRLIRQID